MLENNQLIGFGGENYAFKFTGIVETNRLNYNLRAEIVAAGWDGISRVEVSVTIGSGVIVGSSTTAGTGFTVGTPFPVNSVLRLKNNGFIVGCGGKGGASTGNPGLAGGRALFVDSGIFIDNNGTIGGGGGGGGALVGAGTNNGGGGGAGFNVGLGTHTGANGTLTTGGAGAPSGPGGAGGGLGEPGAADNSFCVAADYYGIVSCTGYAAGGAAGSAISGDINITWGAFGTRLGAIT